MELLCYRNIKLNLLLICFIFHLVLTMYRNALRTFRLSVEEHCAGETEADVEVSSQASI